MSKDKAVMADHGNYVPRPLLDGERIAAGEALRRVVILSPDNAEVPMLDFSLEKDSSLDLTLMALPGFGGNVPINMDLLGENIQVNVSGLCLSSSSDEVSLDIVMNHLAGSCRSFQTFRAIAAGKAQCRFSGTIIVAPDAQRTEAYQESHNMVLGDYARVDAKPRLEIYADDVKCSHGASVGRLDEDACFYMRSRGIPEDEAKVMQMLSFIAPVLESIPEEPDGKLPGREAVMSIAENAVRSL